MIITVLNNIFSSEFMFALWLVPLVVAYVSMRKSGVRRFVFLMLMCVPFLIYFGWAMTGLWSTHEAALAFNRSAQLISIIILVLFIVGLYEHQ